jgi:hypothetical protein
MRLSHELSIRKPIGRSATVDGRIMQSRKEEFSKYERREIKDFNRLRGSPLTTMLPCYAEPEFWYH